MTLLLILIFSLQGVAMLFDEFYFHRKRGLPMWERIGHPLDTLSVLICYSYLAVTVDSQFSPQIYAGLSVFSCLLITKDEWVHKEKCLALEHWLHSLLFVLHPVMLYGAYICARSEGMFMYFQLLFSVTGLMFFYQIFYWNIFVPVRRRGLNHD